MAIDPNLITTVGVGELPPNPISAEDNIPHEVEGVLSRATIQELVNYVRSQSSAYRYEVKILRSPNYGYISDNFDMTPGATQGLGKAGGLWEGWAICNGNNGTDNVDGQTIIGFGANYGIVGVPIGSETHTLTTDEMPLHQHFNGMSDDTQALFVYGGSSSGMPGSATRTIVAEDTLRSFQGKTSFTGNTQPHNIMQPSRVFLIIMKIT